MGINSTAYAYEQAQEFERRHIEVLDGKVAKAREDKRRADVVKIVTAVSAVFLYLFAVIFVSAQVCSVGVQINDLKASIAETENMTARAELELGQLASLDRIQTYVAENLDMVYPAAGDFYFLDEESSATIAMGQQQLAAEEIAAATEVEEKGIWQTFTDFLQGTAKAAEK